MLSVSESNDLASLQANVSALWKAFRELQSEVHESFDIHTAMENHEHQVEVQSLPHFYDELILSFILGSPFGS